MILALTTVAFVSVGLIIGSLMESPEGLHLVSSVVVFPIFFLAGALFPIGKLPVWLAPFTFLDPLTYAVDARVRAHEGVDAAPPRLPLNSADGGFVHP